MPECALSIAVVAPRQRRSAGVSPIPLTVNSSSSPSRRLPAAFGCCFWTQDANCSILALPSFAPSFQAARSTALAWSWSSLGRWPVTLRILWFRTLVRDGERDAGALARPLDTDRRRGRRVPGRVREQVAEHLGDALGVGHRPRQVGPEVDEDGVPAATGQERGAGPVDERGNIRGLGRDGERSRLDAPCIE